VDYWIGERHAHPAPTFGVAAAPRASVPMCSSASPGGGSGIDNLEHGLLVDTGSPPASTG
jgi:hypothetical protein